jgi:hypothetical protein
MPHEFLRNAQKWRFVKNVLLLDFFLHITQEISYIKDGNVNNGHFECIIFFGKAKSEI